MAIPDNKNHHEHLSHTKEYLVIFVILSIFTLIEVYIPNIPSLSHLQKGIGLTTFAGVKAFLVAFYYMHLKDEKPWLRFITCLPFLAILYAYALTIEAIYR